MKIVKEFQFFGHQGTFKQTDFHVFRSVDEAKQYFIDNQIYVCGKRGR